MTVVEVKVAKVEELVWELHDAGRLSWSQAVDIVALLRQEGEVSE